MRAVFLATCLAFSAGPAFAQSLRDTLEKRVEEGLDRSKDKKHENATKTEEPPPEQPSEPAKTEAPAETEPVPPKDEPAQPTDAEPKTEAPKSEGTTLFSFSTEDGVDEEPKPKKKGPKLPVRVIGEDFLLDLQVGGGYRGWIPQQYEAVDVKIGSYFTWTIDVRAKLFKKINIRRGYYESNGLAGPRTEEAAVAAQVGSYAPKAAWLLGALGVPITKAWEPVIRYESRAFETRASPKQAGVCIVPRDADPDMLVPDPNDPTQCPPGDLKIVSGFETFVAGVRYDHSKQATAVVEQRKGKIPPIFFGIGLMQYRKPYQITIDDVTIDEYLFNGRFRGAGLALGTELGGGIDNYFAEADVQFGLGEVSLLESLELNSLAPDDWLIGYIQGSATIGYRWPVIRAAPTLVLIPQLTGGGVSFFFFETQPAEGEKGTTAPVNWDFLWAARLSLLIPL